jgi:type II secretory pathway pseudopilin PulG
MLSGMNRKRANRARLALGLLCQGKYKEAGMTLAEMLVIVVIVGILATIVAPAWRSFYLSRVLATAQDQVFQVIRQAQVAATQSHATWQASFQDSGSGMKWALYPIAAPGAIVWQPLLEVQIDPGLTTLAQQNAIYQLQFNERGNVNGALGKLTLRTPDSSSLKRCVIASTLIGTLRKAADRDCI